MRLSVVVCDLCRETSARVGRWFDDHPATWIKPRWISGSPCGQQQTCMVCAKFAEIILMCSFFSSCNFQSWKLHCFRIKQSFMLDDSLMPVIHAVFFMFTAWRDGFTGPWTKYLKIREIEDGQSEPCFPEDFTSVTVRDKFYNEEFSFSGWHGASGHDAPLIAWVMSLSGREKMEEKW